MQFSSPRRGRLVAVSAVFVLLLAVAATFGPAAHADTPDIGLGDGYAFDNSDIAPGSSIGVNLYDGNAVLSEDDLPVDEASYFVAYSRYYNSRSATTSELGPRWTLDVGVSTRTETLSDRVIVHGPSGYASTFLKNGDGTFQPPVGSGARLTTTANGGLELVDPERRETLLFNSSGNLEKVTDAENRSFTTALTSAAGKTVLSSYGTADGRRINISYNGDQRIREIDDPLSAHRYYGYDAAGRLNSVQTPAGNSTYAYNAQGRLSHATFANGATLDITSDTDGHALVVTVTPAGEAAQTTTYSYQDHQTSVTYPDGSQETYTFDTNGQLTEDPATQAAAEEFYISDTGVSPQQATHDIDLQDRSAPLDDLLIEQLGPQYLGLWFDETTHRVKIAVGPNAPVATVQRALTQYGLSDDTDILTRPFTWTALYDAFDNVNDDLSDLSEDDKVSTTLEPDQGRILISAANDLTAAERSHVEDAAAAASPIPTSVETVNPDDLKARATGDECNSVGNCDKPLRGAQHIQTGTYVNGDGDSVVSTCSVGFITQSTSSSAKRILTAGHCVYATHGGDSANWYAADNGNTFHRLGTRGPGTSFGSGGDYGTISISEPFWKSGLKPYVAQFGGPNEEVTATRKLRLRISRTPASASGTRRSRSIVCSSGVPTVGGAKAVTRCGKLQGLAGKITYTEPDGKHTMPKLIRFRVCTSGARTIQQGNSGGPVYKKSRAYGLISGTTGGSQSAGSCNALIQDVATALRGAKVKLVR